MNNDDKNQGQQSTDNAQLAILMNTVDKLTGLRSRLGLTEYFKSGVGELISPRTWIALFDIDTFIYVNDQFGHLIGDQYLCEIANRLTAATKGNSLAVFRESGDGFVVIGTKMTRARFEWLMRKLQYSIHKKKLPFQCPDKARDRVTVSVLVSDIAYSETADPLGLLSKLDARLVKAKNESEKFYSIFCTELIDNPDM